MTTPTPADEDPVAAPRTATAPAAATAPPPGELIAVTGVTGYLGGTVARTLAAGGESLRLLARRPEAAPKLPGCHIERIAYEDHPAVRGALGGVDALFMVSAHESPDRVDQHCAFVDAAAAAGVRHIVYTSFYGASEEATFTLSRDHARTEAHIEASGMEFTFLRDNFYLDFFVDLCAEGGQICGPAGGGTCSAVTRADVAAVAAAVLRGGRARGVLNLTGPEELSMERIAGTVSRRVGRDIPYIDQTVEEAYASRLAWPAEQWQYDAWVSTYTAIRAGEQSGLSGDVEAILGRKPESLGAYLDRIGL